MKPTYAIRLKIFLPFALGYFLSYVYRTINSIIGPDLTRELGVDPSALGLLTGAYFITFAAFQLPLGILLDRYGPRRVEALLLVIAAVGALVFARAGSLFGLVVGRGLIGLGVSACLMAAFKAYVLWFPKDQLPRINGFQMAAGGLGALAATVPVQTALSVTDWRGVFNVLALATLVMAISIILIVPKKDNLGAETRLADQFRGLGKVAGSLEFWRIAPWTTLSQAALLSIQGLWAGPWLRDVAGLDRTALADTLLMMAAAMMVGFMVIGTLAERLSRRRIAPMAIAATGMGVFLLVQLLLVVQNIHWLTVQWMLFGFSGTAGIISYAALSQKFPAHLAGRINTAINLLVFVAAFAAQWGIGAIINLWPLSAGGGYAPAGYRTAFALLGGLQLLTIAWYWLAGRLPTKSGAAS